MIVNGPHKGKTFADVIQRLRDVHAKRVSDRINAQYQAHYLLSIAKRSIEMSEALKAKADQPKPTPIKRFWWF